MIAGVSRGGVGGGHGGFPNCPFPETPVCGAAACGNGTVDSCELPGDPGCGQRITAETCDGDNVGGKTCADLGFVSGAPTCNSVCSGIVTSRCDDCVTPATDLFSCGDAPGSIVGAGLAVAATDGEVGLAWLASVPNDRVELRFARLAPNLDLLGSTVLLETGTGFAAPIAIAPVPSGWVVAAHTESEVFIHALDASGRSVARTRVGPGDSGFDFFKGTFSLAARPGGGPLLTWHTTNTFAAVIADDGRSASAPIDLRASPADNVVGAAHVGDAFYVLVSEGNTKEGYLWRIGHDGSVSNRVVVLPGESMRLPALAADASDLRIVYQANPAGADPVMAWRRIDATGAAASPRLDLVGPNQYLFPASAVAFGGDTVVLLADDIYANTLAVGRVTMAGQFATPLHTIVKGRTYGAAMTRRGPDLVVAWTRLDDGRIRLARLTP